MEFNHDSDDVAEACGAHKDVVENVNILQKKMLDAVQASGKNLVSRYAEFVVNNYSYEELVIAYACNIKQQIDKQLEKENRNNK